MSVKNRLGYVSIAQAAELLNLKVCELRQMIKINLVPPPMRDIGGTRKYYSPSDIAEIQHTISKGAV